MFPLEEGTVIKVTVESRRGEKSRELGKIEIISDGNNNYVVHMRDTFRIREDVHAKAIVRDGRINNFCSCDPNQTFWHLVAEALVFHEGMSPPPAKTKKEKAQEHIEAINTLLEEPLPTA